MILSVLVDNNAGLFFGAEWGLSFFLEESGKKILFDCGKTDLFIKNSWRMGLDLFDIDFLVLSHAHDDHTHGIASLLDYYHGAKTVGNKGKLVSHPLLFHPRVEIVGDKQRNIGMIATRGEVEAFFDLQLSREPLWITQKLVYLGEIPRLPGSWQVNPSQRIMMPEGIEEDRIKDDSALVYCSEHGLVIITGCSHAGICNIINYAKVVCEDDRIADVIGGFHLLGKSAKELEPIVDQIRMLLPATLHPCHCTDLTAKIELSKVANVKDIQVGKVLRYQ